MTGRILPVPDALSAPYWEACARHVLTMPRCSVCHTFSFPPDVTCPNCHTTAPQFTFEPVSPHGRVRTWTVIRQSFLSGFEIPFVLADVALEDQPHIRLIGQFLDGVEAPLKLGDRVDVVFEDLGSGMAVPAFKTAQSS